MLRSRRRAGKAQTQALALLAIVMAVAAVLLYKRKEGTQSGAFTPRPLFKGLDVGKILKKRVLVRAR